MKKLLKKLALLPLLCGLVLTSACSNDDENGNDIPTSWFNGTITATVVNGNDYNDLIDRVGVFVEFDSNDNWINEKIAIDTWSNSGFTITLPTTLDRRLLWQVGDGFGDLVVVSDANAWMNDMFEIKALDNDNSVIGSFLNIRTNENSMVSAFIVYADRDFTIIGTDYGDTWNISLKKGWNKVYVTETETSWMASTQAVSGLRWYFAEANYDWFSAPTATENTTQSRSVFSRLGR